MSAAEVSGVGLVLGGGGLAGIAFHAGILAALHHDLGWDPNRADVVVGTSAGSVVAALLRTGTSSENLAAWGSGAPPTAAGRAGRRDLDRASAAGWRLRPRPGWQRPTLGHLRTTLRTGRAGAAALSLLPHGWFDPGATWLEYGHGMSDWPSKPLWITAVDTSDATRQVLGRDLHPPLDRAIAASCAIPGLFRPVVIDGRPHIDGGAHSPTNADLLVGSGIERAIVVSPMSGHTSRRRAGQAWRSLAARALAAEVERLEADGISVHVLEPDHDTVMAMGLNPMARSHQRDIVRAAFLAAGAQLGPDLRLALAGSASRNGR